MTMQGVEKTYHEGDYRFQVAYDSGSETNVEQRDVSWSVQQNAARSPDRWVRSFYFKDANERHIHNFCKRFAADAKYRGASISQTADWAIRDRLFRRNIAPEGWQRSPLIEQLGGQAKIYAYFKKHWRTITGLPDYERLVALDGAFAHSTDEPDPEIREAVARFNQIPGVVTRASCQGVSGLVPYSGLEFLADTPHNRLAYIAFAEIPAAIDARLRNARNPAFTHDSLEKRLQATGDNLAFRRVAAEVAEVLRGRS